jgi:hypothetical protein
MSCIQRGSDYETAATAAQGMPACVLSLRGIRATPALAASLAACRAEGPAGAADGSGEGSSASGQQLSGLEAGRDDGEEEEAPVEEAHGGEQQADVEEEEEEGEEEVCQEERQGKSRRRGDATAAVARMRHERIDQAGGGASAGGRGAAAAGDDTEGRAGNQDNGDEARRDVRGQDQGMGAAGGRKKRARAKSGGGGDKSAKRTCSGGKRGRGSKSGGDGTVEDKKEEDAEEERGFPGATPQQQAEADRAWAAGGEVAVRPQSVVSWRAGCDGCGAGGGRTPGDCCPEHCCRRLRSCRRPHIRHRLQPSGPGAKVRDASTSYQPLLTSCSIQRVPCMTEDRDQSM